MDFEVTTGKAEVTVTYQAAKFLLKLTRYYHYAKRLYK